MLGGPTICPSAEAINECLVEVACVSKLGDEVGSCPAHQPSAAVSCAKAIVYASRLRGRVGFVGRLELFRLWSLH